MFIPQYVHPTHSEPINGVSYFEARLDAGVSLFGVPTCRRKLYIIQNMRLFFTFIDISYLYLYHLNVYLVAPKLIKLIVGGFSHSVNIMYVAICLIYIKLAG